MRHKATVLLVLLLAASGIASAQLEEPIRGISVTGTVETKAAPDLVVWRISLMDTDEDMREAKRRNDEKIKSVVALRETLGVGNADFETGRISIRREYERDPHGRRGEFKHFVVSRSVTIRQRDLKRFDDFLDALVSSAEMEVSFTFESSRIHAIRAETRLKALQAAKEKAAAMAEVVGAKLGRATRIDEHGQSGSWQNFSFNASHIQSTPTVDLATDRFVPGAISVQVTVYATFALE